uniref:type II toxin-antitoxin system RelE/ParE family toxin n=1 Tax=Pedobacter schmidteae TaxID=2201271 RepID=UPI001D01AE93|nr:type II toxin-antitoxin system RelE/ParE family toxin [Pedobacter schmidteae]
MAKKFSSLKSDSSVLLQSLKEDPSQGTALGNECYKIRMAITSKGKGKSGGSRVITCFKITRGTVYLLTIFDKSEQENISDKDLKEMLAFVES